MASVAPIAPRTAAADGRSLFVPLPWANANVARCDCFEIDAVIHGSPVRFSDDPTFGLPVTVHAVRLYCR